MNITESSILPEYDGTEKLARITHFQDDLESTVRAVSRVVDRYDQFRSVVERELGSAPERKMVEGELVERVSAACHTESSDAREFLHQLVTEGQVISIPPFIVLPF